MLAALAPTLPMQPSWDHPLVVVLEGYFPLARPPVLIMGKEPLKRAAASLPRPTGPDPPPAAAGSMVVQNLSPAMTTVERGPGVALPSAPPGWARASTPPWGASVRAVELALLRRLQAARPAACSNSGRSDLWTSIPDMRRVSSKLPSFLLGGAFLRQDPGQLRPWQEEEGGEGRGGQGGGGERGEVEARTAQQAALAEKGLKVCKPCSTGRKEKRAGSLTLSGSRRRGGKGAARFLPSLAGGADSELGWPGGGELRMRRAAELPQESLLSIVRVPSGPALPIREQLGEAYLDPPLLFPPAFS